MTYRQIIFEEGHTLGLLRRGGLTATARVLGRHRSTIVREVRRNLAASDGTYRPELADWYARGRRTRSRRNRRFTATYQQKDEATMLEVVLRGAKLRESKW